MKIEKRTYFGFVAIIGATNVGKSTLLNKFIGSKISIVSPKVQTTRMQILGIMQKNATQIVFIDTPGIFIPKRRLDRAMVTSAWNSTGNSDENLLLIDSVRGLDKDTELILQSIDLSDQMVYL